MRKKTFETKEKQIVLKIETVFAYRNSHSVHAYFIFSGLNIGGQYLPKINDCFGR